MALTRKGKVAETWDGLSRKEVAEKMKDGKCLDKDCRFIFEGLQGKMMCDLIKDRITGEYLAEGCDADDNMAEVREKGLNPRLFKWSE